MDAGELRKKHEELREKVTRAREALLEARAKQRSLDERIAEYEKELVALGVDPAKLDEAIATEEAAIAAELAEIEVQLKDPTAKPTKAPPQPTPDWTKLRTPEGNINNCSLAAGAEEKTCQICKGQCPDRAKFGAARPPTDVDLDELLNVASSE